VFDAKTTMSGRKNSSNVNPPVTIFVVDDEPILLDLALTILEPLGYHVQTFRDPKAALKAFSTAKPSVVVTDYAMGDMTGMDLLEEFRRLNPQQKIILLSGTVDERIYADEKNKPDCFLSKPYQVRDLVVSVQTLLKA
jgi:CheY-like chemotaxis protein